MTSTHSTTLLLVRHGETDWNRDRRWQGRTGAPLNATGRSQAVEVAARIGEGIAAIYTSDSERARETALIIAEGRGLDVQHDPRLGEVDFGLWEGLTRREIDDRFGDAIARWSSGESSTPDGGESDETMAARVFAALAEIAAGHPGQRVVVVTSSGPIRAVEARLRGLEPGAARERIATVANCSVVEIEVAGRSWRYGTRSRIPD